MPFKPPGGLPGDYPQSAGPSTHTQHQRPYSKFEKIAAHRRESQTAIRKKQAVDLDLSPALTPPAVMDTWNAVVTGPPESITASSFEQLPASPQLYMYDVIGVPEASCIDPAMRENAMEGLAAAVDAYHGRSGDNAVVVQTSMMGSFVARPEQREALR